MRNILENPTLSREFKLGAGILVGTLALSACGGAETPQKAGPDEAPGLDVIDDFTVYRKFTPSGKMITVVEIEGRAPEDVIVTHASDVTLSYCDNGALVEVSYWADSDNRVVIPKAEVCTDNRLTASDYPDYN